MDLINKTCYKTFLALSIFCIPHILGAWELDYLNGKAHYPYSVVELDDGDFVVTNTEAINDTVVRSFLLHLSPSGSVINVIDFTDFFSGKSLYLQELKLLYGNLYWAGALQDSSNQFSAVLIKMDQDLNVLKDTVYQGKQYWTSHFFEYDTDKILAAFTDFSDSTEYRGYLIANRDLTLSTVWIDSTRMWKYHNLGNSAYNKKDNRMYVSSWRYDVFSYELPSFNKVDSFRNLDIDMWSSPLSTENGNTIVPCLKKIFPSQPPWVSKSDLFLISLDTNMQVKDTFQFDDEIEHRVGEINTVVQAGNFIYYGSTKNISTSNFIKDDTVHTSFHLIKLDLNLNMIWSKSLKSDVSYQLFTIQATSDQGVIMVGQRWDWVSNPNQDSLSLYIVKLDSNGVSTGTYEKNLNAVRFNIYPNPSTDFIYVDIDELKHGETYRLKVYDLNGNLVIQDSITDHKSLDISKLKRGVYILSLEDNKTCSKQKFIKN